MKDVIKSILLRDDIVGRRALSTALVRLYARQTNEEQESGTTHLRNGKGFSAFHSKQGTYLAQYVLGANINAPTGVINPSQWDEEIKKLIRNERTSIRLISGEKNIDRARKIAFFHINQLVEEAEIRKRIPSPNS